MASMEYFSYNCNTSLMDAEELLINVDCLSNSWISLLRSADSCPIWKEKGKRIRLAYLNMQHEGNKRKPLKNSWRCIPKWVDFSRTLVVHPVLYHQGHQDLMKYQQLTRPRMTSVHNPEIIIKYYFLNNFF